MLSSRAAVLPTKLEAAGLSKSFAGPPLFSGLSFTVASGLTAVVGPNGRGKTTLIKILASLVRPGSGTVRISRGPEDLSGDAKRRAVGWAGMDLAFYEDFTAIENLRFFRRAAGAAEDPGLVEARLAEVGLTHAAGKRVGAYSTGMKQRLRMAFARLFEPAILLLDEPMAGLDEEGRAAVARIIASSRQAGAVVLASNDARDFEAPEQVVELGK